MVQHGSSDEIEQLTTIKVDDDEYRIKFFLGADWKFLALVVGIKSASAIYSCIWCTCASHERYDVTMAWSLQDKQRDARAIEDIKELAKVKKTGVEFPEKPIDPRLYGGLMVLTRMY